MSKYHHLGTKSLYQHSTGKQFKLGGYRPDPTDVTDKKYSVGRYQEHQLPSKVDLRAYMTSVEQQGELESCTANAMAGAYEYLAMRQLGSANDVSRLFIYYNARATDGAPDKDQGTYLRTCIKVLQEYGACAEETWPYDLNYVFKEPHEVAYNEAANFLIEEAHRVKVDLYDMRHCLAEGYPFAFGLQLFNSFAQAEYGGRVPMPSPDSETHIGGHAMLCVGYSDQDQVFLVRNSWGSDWGDKGYCYIPYDYMTNPELNGDCWTIHSVTDLDFSDGVWHEEDSFFDDNNSEEDDDSDVDDSDYSEDDSDYSEDDSDDSEAST